jgi:LemA protein
MIVGLVLAVAGAALALWAIGAYNSLVRKRQETQNAWSQIDVQLKRRHDLIPNLVEAVKGYLAHERQTLERVIAARTQAVNATGLKDKAQAENLLTQTLRSLFAVSERYPELRANQNVLSLQEELTSTENRISFARQFYNDQVMRLNTAVESVPTNLIAGLTGFQKAEFFELEDTAHREAPRVAF